MKGAGHSLRSIHRASSSEVVRTGSSATRCTSPTSPLILGSGAVFGAWELVAWAAVVLVAFHLFVVIYEEPTLKRSFGRDYEAYQRDVGRWVPRRLGMVVQRRDERA